MFYWPIEEYTVLENILIIVLPLGWCLFLSWFCNPEEWKRAHEYGRRSLVETVFGMMKLRYGGSLSSRGGMERRRELLIKVVLHNIERLNFLECAGR